MRTMNIDQFMQSLEGLDQETISLGVDVDIENLCYVLTDAEHMILNTEVRPPVYRFPASDELKVTLLLDSRCDDTFMHIIDYVMGGSLEVTVGTDKLYKIPISSLKEAYELYKDMERL